MVVGRPREDNAIMNRYLGPSLHSAGRGTMVWAQGNGIGAGESNRLAQRGRAHGDCIGIGKLDDLRKGVQGQVRRIQRNDIGAGKLDGLHQRAPISLGGRRSPGRSFIKKETIILPLPIWSPITPEKEEHFERVTGERTEIDNKEADRLGRDYKFESTVTELLDKELTKLLDKELIGNPTNGCLEKMTNRILRETVFTPSKRHHK